MKLVELDVFKNEELNLDEYIEARNEVRKNAMRLEWIGDLEKEDIAKMIQKGSSLWVFKKDGDVVCSMMGMKLSNESLTELGIGVSTEEAIEYGPIFVKNKYRVNRLQYQMLRFMEEHYKEKGYKYAVATVHPENQYSAKNFLLNDFTLESTKTFPRGLRNIYIKKF